MKTQPITQKACLAVMTTILVVMLIIPFTMVSQKPMMQSPLKPINEADDDKTLSPYFFVKSENPDVDQLPLKETSAEVNIAGVIADVKVKQVYTNNGKSALEAIYVFPASTRAAVYDMRMTVGDRLLIAKIQEKEKARQQYEDAKNQGKSASLLEEERPNVFQMNVANIMPGDTITVELSYTELLIPESGVYEFDYPTVVGPRYSNTTEATASSDDKWVSNPYTHEGVLPNYTFDIKARINAGMKIKAVSCPSHLVDVNYEDKNSVQVSLKKSETDQGNRDFILQYKLADNAIESGLLLYKGENSDENFFLTMIQPPARPEIDQVPPRDYVFILDVSGSMYGFPVETEKKLVTNLIEKLRPVDKFNVMLFAGSSTTLADQSIPATKDNLKKAIDLIEKQSGGGGTEILPALTKALALKKSEGFSRTFVISTDGYVSVETETFDLIKNNLGNSNFFAFGIGTSVNRYIIEGMAHVGFGEPFVVTNEADCEKKAEKFRTYIQTPVLTDVKADYNGFDVYDLEPVNVPDVLAERPIIIYGKYKGEPKGSITISGKTGSKDFAYTINVAESSPSQNNRALKYLWARQKIRMLDDYNNVSGDEKQKEEITAMGLKYNLLTKYTSFIAIDSLIRNTSGKINTVKQPLPLPDKVSDYAVEKSRAMGGNSGNKSYSPSYYSTQAKDEIEDDLTIGSITVAVYSGGESAMNKFITDNLIVPEAAKTAGISGTVYIQFTLDEKGNISDVKVVQSLGYGCDEEAERVVKLMAGKWVAATQGGNKISSTVIVPVKF